MLSTREETDTAEKLSQHLPIQEIFPKDNLLFLFVLHDVKGSLVGRARELSPLTINTVLLALSSTKRGRKSEVTAHYTL